MCNLNIKKEFEKKLNKSKISEYFLKMFGQEYTAQKFNSPGWWFDNINICLCITDINENIQTFITNKDNKVKKIRKILYKMGYKYEYSIKNKFILFLKDKIS